MQSARFARLILAFSASGIEVDLTLWPVARLVARLANRFGTKSDGGGMHKAFADRGGQTACRSRDRSLRQVAGRAILLGW
jgi:hypothetical protein